MATGTATPRRPTNVIDVVARAAGALLLLAACPSAEPPDAGGDPGTPAASSPPARAVVIGPSTAETLAWLGLEKHVVGVSDFCVAPEFAGLPRVGGQLDPNLERIAALAPELVLAQGAQPRVMDWCASAGVRYEALKTQSVAAWRAEVRALASWFDCAARAEARLAEWDAAYAALAAPVDGATDTEDTRPGTPPGPLTLIVASREPERIAGLLVAGRGSFLGELLEHVGGRNLYADHARDYFDLSEETLLRTRPEVILELGGAQSDAERLATWRAAFPSLPAVEAGRVHGLTADHVWLPGPRMLDTARLLRDRLGLADD